jgi:hypothetical protein
MSIPAYGIGFGGVFPYMGLKFRKAARMSGACKAPKQHSQPFT